MTHHQLNCDPGQSYTADGTPDAKIVIVFININCTLPNRFVDMVRWLFKK